MKKIIFILTLMFILCSFSVLGQYNANLNCTPGNRASVYLFNESSGNTVTDFCGNDHGTINDGGGSNRYNITSPTGDNMVWGSNDTTTNDYVSSTGEHCTGDSACSIEMWVNWSASGGADRFFVGLRYGLYEWTGVYCTMNNGSATDTAKYVLTADQWYHIACIYNGTTNRLIVNGIERAYINKTGSISIHTNNNIAMGDGRSAKGMFDYVRYFDGVLKCTLADISDNSSGDTCSYFYAPPVANNPPYYSGSISNITIDYSNYSSIIIGQSYYILDDDNDTMNCSLYVNDTIVYNFTSITNNTELNYTWTGMTKHETLDYYYNCTDSTDFNATAIDTTYLIYQNTACTNSANPGNYPWSSGSENKTYANTVTDLDGDTMSVYFFWNGTLNQTNNSISSGTTINIIQELIAHNDYTHRWYCIDPYQASNTTTSLYYSNYTQACPVQTINLGSFTFNSAYTENFTVNSTDADNDNVTIYFYWNGILDSTNSSYTLGTNWTVQKPLANETSYTYYWMTVDDYCNTTSSTYNVAWSGAVSASGDDFSYLILLLILTYAFAFFVVSKRSTFLAGIIYLLGALAVLVIGTSTFTTMLGMVLILGSLGVLIGDIVGNK